MSVVLSFLLSDLSVSLFFVLIFVCWYFLSLGAVRVRSYCPVIVMILVPLRAHFVFFGHSFCSYPTCSLTFFVVTNIGVAFMRLIFVWYIFCLSKKFVGICSSIRRRFSSFCHLFCSSFVLNFVLLFFPSGNFVLQFVCQFCSCNYVWHSFWVVWFFL